MLCSILVTLVPIRTGTEHRDTCLPLAEGIRLPAPLSKLHRADLHNLTFS